MKRILEVSLLSFLLAEVASAECMLTAPPRGAGPPSYQVKACIPAMDFVERTPMYVQWQQELKERDFFIEGSALALSREYRTPKPEFLGIPYEPHAATVHYPGTCQDVPLEQDVTFDVPEQDCCESAITHINCFFDYYVESVELE